MTLTYRLSDKQAKELLVRGQVIEIALPCTDPDCDPIEFARAALPDHAQLITDADFAEITVWRTSGAADGFGGLMGHICSEKSSPSSRAIEYTVIAVVATLRYVGQPRGRLRLAWPGKAYRDGMEIT